MDRQKKANYKIVGGAALAISAMTVVIVLAFWPEFIIACIAGFTTMAGIFGALLMVTGALERNAPQ